MTEAEHLRDALAECDRLLREGRIASAHANTLLVAMDVFHHADMPEEALEQVLEIIREAVGADMALLVGVDSEGGLKLRAGTHSDIETSRWCLPVEILRRPHRLTDIVDANLMIPLAGDAISHSLLAVPVQTQDEWPIALIMVSEQVAHFSRFDFDLLRRMAPLFEKSIDRLRIADRNAVLANMVDKRSQPTVRPFFSDTSFDSLRREFDRVVAWQGHIIDITNELLAGRSDSVDDAIDRALARTGELAGSDRTYVFRLRPPNRLDNTHEWVAAGIDPMIAQLQDLSGDMLDDWRSDLEAGRPVYLPDINALPDDYSVKDVLHMQGIRSLLVVPMMQNGRLNGFVGYDAVRAPRSFLPIEIQLLKSVANAVAVVLDRAAAETKAAEAISRLVHERNRSEATLAALPYIVLEFDTEGRCEQLRVGGTHVPLVPPEDALGRLPEEFLPSELAHRARSMMAEANRHCQSQPQEYSLDINGQTHWFEATAAVKEQTGQKKIGHIFVIRDITERRKRQRKIRRLSRVAELTTNYLIVMDPDGLIEWVNPALERRSGWSLEELNGRGPEGLLGGQAPPTKANLGKRSTPRPDSRLAPRDVVRCSDRSGGEYTVSMDIQPILDRSGTLEGFVSVQTDITELEESHQRAMSVRAQALEASSDGIGTTDPDGFYTYLNPAHRLMFDIGLDEAVGTLSWRDLYDAETGRRLETEALPKLFAEGSWRGRTRGLSRGGRMIEQDLALSLTADGGILCITRDVSGLRKMEAERERLREKLQLAQRRETVAQLAAGIAHDLNNFVAVVAGTVELLSAETAGNKALEAGLNRISTTMDTVRDLVSGLGDLARPIASNVVVDLRKIIVETVDLLGTERVEEHLVESVLPEVELPVRANRTALLQVAVNLALNACESDPFATVWIAAGRQPPVELRSEPDIGSLMPGQDYAFFTVRDTGGGVDAVLRERLFERYLTTKGNAGTGLGLPIVAGILNDYGGVLWFDSRPGEGTAVTVAWPMGRRGHDERHDDVDVSNLAGDLTGYTLLVLDDVSDVAEVLARMLETDGADATAISDPRQAMDLLEKEPERFSAIVTDLNMPGRSGVDVARVAMMQKPSIPCILVTANPKGQELNRHRSLFHSVLKKPVDSRALSRAVLAAVRRSSRAGCELSDSDSHEA